MMLVSIVEKFLNAIDDGLTSIEIGYRDDYMKNIPSSIEEMNILKWTELGERMRQAANVVMEKHISLNRLH